MIQIKPLGDSKEGLNLIKWKGYAFKKSGGIQRKAPFDCFIGSKANHCSPNNSWPKIIRMQPSRNGIMNWNAI